MELFRLGRGVEGIIIRRGHGDHLTDRVNRCLAVLSELTEHSFKRQEKV